MVFAKRKTYHV